MIDILQGVVKNCWLIPYKVLLWCKFTTCSNVTATYNICTLTMQRSGEGVAIECYRVKECDEGVAIECCGVKEG